MGGIRLGRGPCDWPRRPLLRRVSRNSSAEPGCAGADRYMDRGRWGQLVHAGQLEHQRDTGHRDERPHPERPACHQCGRRAGCIGCYQRKHGHDGQWRESGVARYLGRRCWLHGLECPDRDQLYQCLVGGHCNHHLAGSNISAYLDGVVAFQDSSTAGNASLTVSNQAEIAFFSNSTAAQSTLNVGAGGFLAFTGSASAGSAHISNAADGLVAFLGTRLLRPQPSSMIPAPPSTSAVPLLPPVAAEGSASFPCPAVETSIWGAAR